MLHVLKVILSYSILTISLLIAIVGFAVIGLAGLFLFVFVYKPSAWALGNFD
jgi:hypothetical protein